MLPAAARHTLFAVLAAVVCVAPAAQAQTYPDKPIRFVAATSPGATADLLARTLAEAMSKVLNQSIVVENRPGADQIIGLELIAKGAPADGYTVGVIGFDGQAQLPLVKKSLRFDPMADIVAAAGLGEVRYALVGPATAPFKNFQELIAAVKATPGKFNYGSSGPQVRFASQVLIKELGLNMVHVPFPGGGPYLTAAAAGTIDWAIVAEGSSRTLKPRVRVYAMTGKTRSTGEPDVPTFAELGFPRIHGPAYALSLRSGTPKPILDRLAAAAQTALASPEMRANSQKFLFEPNFENAESITRTINERFNYYKEYARAGVLVPE